MEQRGHRCLTPVLGPDYAPIMIRWAPAAVAVLLCGGPAWSQRTEVSEQSKKQAASQFERGEKLYNTGQFAEAIRAFSQANQLAPHHRSLFNIARCYENLGDMAKALEFYTEALAAPGIDPPSQADIQQRIKRLRSRPVKVFVSSRPSGARVTVDGRAEAEQGQTPLVLSLPPGEHLLLLRMEGHHLAAHRIAVEMDKELPVEVALEPLPKTCPPPPPPCPKPRSCPKPRRRVDLRRLHIHFHLLGAFGLTTDRPVAGGPGVQILGTFRRFVFGGYFLGLPMGQEPVTGNLDVSSGITLENRTFSWLVGQLEGGYGFPFDNFYIYTTAGLGLSADRVVFRGTQSGVPDSFAKEKVAFIWSIGGGIEAMATRWLSFGGAIRFGMLHGNRVAKDDPNKIDAADAVNAPYGTFWGNVTFHL